MSERFEDKNQVPLSPAQSRVGEFVTGHTARVQARGNVIYLATGLYVMRGGFNSPPANLVGFTSTDQYKFRTSRESVPPVERIEQISYYFADDIGEAKRHPHLEAGKVLVVRLTHRRDLQTDQYEDGGSFVLENSAGKVAFLGRAGGDPYADAAITSLENLEAIGNLTIVD
jgi:hypothetical protein